MINKEFQKELIRLLTKIEMHLQTSTKLEYLNYFGTDNEEARKEFDDCNTFVYEESTLFFRDFKERFDKEEADMDKSK